MHQQLLRVRLRLPFSGHLLPPPLTRPIRDRRMAGIGNGHRVLLGHPAFAAHFFPLHALLFVWCALLVPRGCAPPPHPSPRRIVRHAGAAVQSSPRLMCLYCCAAMLPSALAHACLCVCLCACRVYCAGAGYRESLQWWRDSRRRSDEEAGSDAGPSSVARTASSPVPGSSVQDSPEGARATRAMLSASLRPELGSAESQPGSGAQSPRGGRRSSVGGESSLTGPGHGTSHVHAFDLGSRSSGPLSTSQIPLSGPALTWVAVSRAVSAAAGSCVNAVLCVRRCFFLEDVPPTKRRVASMAEVIAQVRPPTSCQSTPSVCRPLSAALCLSPCLLPSVCRPLSVCSLPFSFRRSQRLPTCVRH
jgi:hypothetical protein